MTSTTAPSPRYRILIVDDENQIRILLRDYFANIGGHHCVEATDGADALRKIEQEAFDAVISDIKMPNMDGLSMTMELARNHPDLPIMLITGFDEEYGGERALAAGAREYVIKPFNLTDLSIRFYKMMRDHTVLSVSRKKQIELQKISNRMIQELQCEAEEKIKHLTEEINSLRKEP